MWIECRCYEWESMNSIAEDDWIKIFNLLWCMYARKLLLATNLNVNCLRPNQTRWFPSAQPKMQNALLLIFFSSVIEEEECVCIIIKCFSVLRARRSRCSRDMPVLFFGSEEIIWISCKFLSDARPVRLSEPGRNAMHRLLGIDYRLFIKKNQKETENEREREGESTQSIKLTGRRCVADRCFRLHISMQRRR